VTFETPTADLSVEDLKQRYGVSKQTLYNRINAAAVVGKRVKGKTFFTPQEVWSLDQVASFVERGVTLTEVTRLVQEYKQKQEAEPDLQASQPEPDLRVVDAPPFEAQGVTMPAAPSREYDADASGTALAVFAEREEQARVLAGALTLAVGKALQDTKEVVSDPLRTHRLLAEAAREEWVLTGTQLAEVCGVGGPTVTSWRPHTVRCGFWLEAATQGLWTVRKATHEELLEHAAAHARPVPRGRPKKQEAE
jgi:hypothetical protein